MKQEILDLIHLNTYVDYSANKATDEDINQLLSKRRIELGKDYLDFLRQLNGFKVYQLNIYGTKRQDDLNVEDVWYNNDYYAEEKPDMGDYFIIGHGHAEHYAYNLKEKKYCSLEFKHKGVYGGKAFDNLNDLLDSAVKQHAKRFNEETKIISRKALLHLADQISLLVKSRNFQSDGGSIILNSGYSYLRVTPLATERLGISLQTDSLRTKLTLSIGAYKRYNLIEDLFQVEGIKKVLRRGNNDYTILLYQELPGYQSEFSEQEMNDNYEAITTSIISFFEAHVFRAFTLYDDVRVLDKKVNESLGSVGNLERGNVIGFHKMIIAKLAGNPMYDEIFRSVKERFEKESQEFLKITISLNDELQNHRIATNLIPF